MQKHNCTNTKRNGYQSLKHVAIHFDSFLFFRNGIPRYHKFQRKHKDTKNRMLLPSFPPALCIQYKRFETLCQGFLLHYVGFFKLFRQPNPILRILQSRAKGRALEPRLVLSLELCSALYKSL